MNQYIHIIAFRILFVIACFACNNNAENGKTDSDVGKAGSEANSSQQQVSAFEAGMTTNKTNMDDSGAGGNGNYLLSVRFTPYIPAYDGLGESGRKLLSDRLNGAISKVGIGGAGANPRLIIGADINLLSKNVTATAPAKYVNTYEIALITCDVLRENIFGTYSFEFKSVGDSPEKAFINGFRDFKLENDSFYQFLVDSEKKMLEFYGKNCSTFIDEAESEAKSRNFEGAFLILNNIPPEAESCFKLVRAKKAEFFQMSLNLQCQSLLASMKAELGKANDASASGFNEQAMAYYQMIDRGSSCFPEAEKVYQSYLKKLDPKSKCDWEQKTIEYKDRISRMEKLDALKRDSLFEDFSFRNKQKEYEMKIAVEGNKKLLQKYQYDELPWLRKIFHLGKYDPFDRVDN